MNSTDVEKLRLITIAQGYIALAQLRAAGMTAENQQRQATGDSPAFGQEHFLEASGDIQYAIQLLAPN